MAIATQSTMAKEEFQRTKEYLALTPRQRSWVTTLIEEHDAGLATRTAYGAPNGPYAAMLTRKIETSPRIIAALNRFYCRSPREAFLLDLERTIQRESGPAKVSAMQLYARLTLSDESKKPAEPVTETESPVQKFAIGSVIVQDDKKYLVKAEEI